VNERPEFSITSLIIFSDMRLSVTSVHSEERWKYDSKVIPMPWRQTKADAIKAKLASGGLTLRFYNCGSNVRELIRILNCEII
jgi:hypothetical protein